MQDLEDDVDMMDIADDVDIQEAVADDDSELAVEDIVLDEPSAAEHPKKLPGPKGSSHSSFIFAVTIFRRAVVSFFSFCVCF